MIPTAALVKQFRQYAIWCAIEPHLTIEQLAERWHTTTRLIAFRQCGLTIPHHHVNHLLDLRRRLIRATFLDYQRGYRSETTNTLLHLTRRAKQQMENAVNK